MPLEDDAAQVEPDQGGTEEEGEDDQDDNILDDEITQDTQPHHNMRTRSMDQTNNNDVDMIRQSS